MENAQALSPGTQNLYYSSLDFLSLAGLDGSPGATHDFESPTGAVGDASAPASASASASHSRNHSYSHSHAHGGHGGNGSALDGAGHGSQGGDPDTPLDDPSPISLDPHHHHHSHSQSSSHAHHTSHHHNNRMDDHQASGSGGHSSGHGGHQHVPGSGHNTPALDASNEYANMDVSASAYDAMQAGMLQHQLESIHMQSPFFGATNPQSPYGAMAQMFLTSPPAQSSSSSSQQQEAASQGALPDHRPHMPQRKFSAQNVLAGVGLLTPGPSGEMLPDVRMDLMSPMQLEMLARSEMIEGMENFNGAPLLSPALSHHTNSNYASPVSQVAFNGGGGGQLNANRHALEKLQQQQQQFQEQLALLQEQQRQLQATAAAVAASSGSPYLSAQHHQQRHSGLNQGGASGSGHSAGSISTPSPGSYFSPLTSPALEPAVSRSAALRAAAAHLSPGLHSQHQRQPHPLSALSSPALNPVGSSGGAQQTLSPALAPQNDTEVDGDYLSALQGFLDGAGGPSDAAHQGSPVIGPSNHSPAIGASGSTGPHRGSLPAKSRPSPMMKPTHHRSHGRHGSNSVTTSPMAFKVPNSSQAGMGFLPPAAIDQRGVQLHQQQQQQQHNASESSTPSPVDLALIMPPPPVPPPGGRPKSLMPMTPASLMNLKADGESRQGGPSAETSPVAQNAASSSSVQPARPAAAAKKPSPPVINVPKRGSRLVPSGGAAAAKRALAIRPPGGVGVRAAAKNAAAAAANAEPETRRTSHKAAEQKRRDSLKAGFDELRLLLPPINTEALDPESGEPIPGSSAPRLLPKSSLVPDDNPNRGVSKVALLKFSNEYIVRLHDKVEKRDGYIDKLRDEVRRLRGLGDPDAADDEVRGDKGEDLLEMDMLEGEEDDLGSDENDDDMEVDDDRPPIPAPSQTKKKGGPAVGKSPHLGPTKRASRSTSGASSAKSSRRVSASGAD